MAMADGQLRPGEQQRRGADTCPGRRAHAGLGGCARDVFLTCRVDSVNWSVIRSSAKVLVGVAQACSDGKISCRLLAAPMAVEETGIGAAICLTGGQVDIVQKEDLARRIAEITGYEFTSLDLLWSAFTHASCVSTV